MSKRIYLCATAFCMAMLAAGCGDDSAANGKKSGSGAGGSGHGGGGTGGTTGTGGHGGAGGGAPSGIASDLLALVKTCTPLPGTTKFATDQGQPDTVPVCGLKGAVWWQADMDIDCDGGQSSICMADPDYLGDTSAHDSHGGALDASTLPYVVVPLPNHGFNYTDAGLKLGSVIAVLYKGKLEYGIFGDEGPKEIIGEASYAMAQRLGIDADPVKGGVDSGVTYIAFTGDTAVVNANENHDEAAQIGAAHAAALVNDNHAP